MKLLGIISVDFNVTDQMLITYSAFVRYWTKKREYNGAVHQLFADFNKAYQSGEKYCTIFSLNLV